MKILDMNNNEVTTPDLSNGYLKQESIFVQHHEAVEAVEEVYHYEYGAAVGGVFVSGAKYQSGGQDREKVIDCPGQPAVEAWDEYEEIQRYIEYTQEELDAIEAEKNKPTAEQRIAELEQALEMILAGVTE